MLEFLFDTTRAVVDLVLNGTIARCPDLELIVPHAGATLPRRRRPCARVRAAARRRPVGRRAPRPRPSCTSTWPACRCRASSTRCSTLTTLEHLHYGSDFPFTPELRRRDGRRRLDASPAIRRGSLTDALRANTERLFPRLRRRPLTAREDLTMNHQIELGYLVLEVPGARQRSRRCSPTSSGSFPASRRRPARDVARRRTRAAARGAARARRTTRSPSASRRSTAPRSTRPSTGSAAIGCRRRRGHRRRRERGGSNDWSAPRRRGVSTSSSCSGSPTRPTPYSSPLVPGGFLTEGVGFGHVVFATTAFDESVRVPHRRPRARAVRLARDRARARHQPRGALLPLQRPAPHRGARARTVRAAAGAPPRDVRGERRATTSAPRSTGPGRRSCRSRTGSAVTTTTGCSASTSRPRPASRSSSATARASSATTGTTTGCYDRISAWGHQPLPRRREPPERRPSTSRSSARGPVGSSCSRSCSRSAGGPSSCSSGGPTPYTLPRAVHFDDEVGRILQSCGIGDEVRAITEPAEVYEWRNARGHDAAALRSASARPRRAGRSRRCSASPSSRRCSNGAARVAADVEIRRGVDGDRRSNAGRRRASSSAAARRPGPGALRRRLRRRELDRARPARHRRRRPRVLLRLADRRRASSTNPGCSIRSTSRSAIRPGRRPPCRAGPGRRRWEFMRLPARVARRARRRSAGVEAARALGRASGQRPASNGTRSTRSKRRVADRWQDGRGVPRRRRRAPDAAVRRPGHVLRDSRRGEPRVEARPGADRPGAPTRCLDTYEEERRPGAAAAIDVLDRARQGDLRPRRRPRPRRATRRWPPASATSRNPRRSSRTSRRDSSHPTAPHAGTQFVQGLDGGSRFDEVHGNGWRLVVLGADVECIGRDERTWFESIGGRVVALGDPDALFSKWFARHDTTCALQRPDFYLYGTAPTAAAATQLLADLRRHLAEGSTR